MPYASAAMKRAREKVRIREAVESGKYSCPKCTYAFDEHSYLNKHEKRCSRLAISEPSESITEVADVPNPVLSLMVEPVVVVNVAFGVSPIPAREVEKVVEAPVVAARRSVGQKRVAGNSVKGGGTLGVPTRSLKRSFIHP